MYQHQRQKLWEKRYGVDCCSDEFEKKMKCVYDDEGELLYEIEDTETIDYRNTLSMEMLKAAEVGDTNLIRDSLGKEMDVNIHCDEEDLLSRACAKGQLKVVQTLLECPDIHLNRIFGENTPLERAHKAKHLNCVEALLSYNGKCRPYLYNSWNSVVQLLKMDTVFSQSSVLHILNWAGHMGKWVAVSLILQKDYYIPEDSMYQLLLQAIDKENWEIVFEVFKKNFSRKNQILLEIFGVAINLKRCKEIQQILQIIDPNSKLELQLIHTALGGNPAEVHRLLQSCDYNVQVLRSLLLVIAASGTTPEVVQMMMEIREVYTRRNFSDALYLGSLGYLSNVILPLLGNTEASFTFHELYMARRAMHQCKWTHLHDTNNDLEKAFDHAMKMAAIATGF